MPLVLVHLLLLLFLIVLLPLLATAAAAWHMQEQQRLALLDAQTHTQSQSYAPQPAPSTHHQGGFGVKRKAHGAWGLGGPPRPASPTTSNQPVLQPAQPGPGSAPPAEYLWC